MSLDVCIHPWSQHHNQGNKDIPHLQITLNPFLMVITLNMWSTLLTNLSAQYIVSFRNYAEQRILWK